MRVKRSVERRLLGGLVAGLAAVIALVDAAPASAGHDESRGEATVTNDEDAFLSANRIWVTQTFDEEMTFPA